QHAMNKVKRAISEGRHLDPNESFASFIVITGPPGSGKSVGAQLFGKWFDEFHMMAGDQMHSSAHVNQMVGSPAGYLGSNETSLFEKLFVGGKRSLLTVDGPQMPHPPIHDALAYRHSPGALRTATNAPLY